MIIKAINKILKKSKSKDLDFSQQVNTNQTSKIITPDYNFNQKYYHQTFLSTNGLSFGKFYNIHKKWQKYLVVAICSLFIAACYYLFMQYTGVSSAGISSLNPSISRLTRVSMFAKGYDPNLINIIYNLIFWLLFFVLNIPLAIFSYFKLGKNFTKLTIFGIIVGDVFGFLLGIIPNSQTNTLIFGESLSSFEPLKDQGVQLLFWKANSSGINDLVRSIPLFLYAIIGSLILPIFYSVIYIVGASTGGTDFISYYYSIKKHKPLGSIIAYFNSASLIIGVFMGSYISASIANVNLVSPEVVKYGKDVFVPWSFSLFLSPNLIASIIGSVLMGWVINLLYPKSKMVKLKVFANDVQKIADALFAIKYAHSFTISKSIGAYSKMANENGESVCQYIELPKVIEYIHKIDPKAFMYVEILKEVHGVMNIKENID